MRRPALKTSIPGPKGQALINQDQEFMSPSYTRAYPLVVERGEGCWLYDVDGNEFLDFNAGIAVCNTGHCHPKVVQAIQNQAQRLIHMSFTDFYNLPNVELGRRLAQAAPGDSPKKAYFGNSGAEAVEAAFKLARKKTGRQFTVAFLGAFHGRTMGAISLTASKAVYRKDYSPFVPGILHIPYANCYRCPFNLTHPSCGMQCVHWLEDVYFKATLPPEEVAAFFVEPIQGEGGYIVPPREFHEELFKLAEKYGILYVSDEVQAGMGRTGKLFAIEHFGITPHILTLAKGIASGMPLGAVVADENIMDWEKGSHGSTFGGNPVACAAALASLDLIQESLMENARIQGERLLAGLAKIQEEFECIGDVRGKGLMVATEIVKDRTSKKPDKNVRGKIVQQAFQSGLLLLECGESAIRFSPALVVSSDEVDVCLDIFRSSVKKSLDA